MSQFQLLLQTISQAKDKAELRSLISGELGPYFEAKRWGILFFDQLWANSTKVPPQAKLALSTTYNPVLRYVVERHTPAHEELVVSPKIWHLICPRQDHWHVMAGPLLNHSQLAGLIGLTPREKEIAALVAQGKTNAQIGTELWITKNSVK